MIYELTKANIYAFMRGVGYAKGEQLVNFFRDTVDADNVVYYLHDMANKHLLDYTPETDTFADFQSMKGNSETIRSRVYAVWLVVEYGSQRIRDICTMEYPGEICFITDENAVYCISYIYDTSMARLSLNKRNRHAGDQPDGMHHIALVLDEKVGAQMKDYGFECYCILDKEHKPHYHYFDED